MSVNPSTYIPERDRQGAINIPESTRHYTLQSVQDIRLERQKEGDSLINKRYISYNIRMGITFIRPLRLVEDDNRERVDRGKATVLWQQKEIQRTWKEPSLRNFLFEGPAFKTETYQRIFFLSLGSIHHRLKDGPTLGNMLRQLQIAELIIDAALNRGVNRNGHVVPVNRVTAANTLGLLDVWFDDLSYTKEDYQLITERFSQRFPGRINLHVPNDGLGLRVYATCLDESLVVTFTPGEPVRQILADIATSNPSIKPRGIICHRHTGLPQPENDPLTTRIQTWLRNGYVQNQFTREDYPPCPHLSHYQCLGPPRNLSKVFTGVSEPSA